MERASEPAGVRIVCCAASGIAAGRL